MISSLLERSVCSLVGLSTRGYRAGGCVTDVRSCALAQKAGLRLQYDRRQMSEKGKEKDEAQWLICDHTDP
jgi:hypothetical protein